VVWLGGGRSDLSSYALATWLSGPFDILSSWDEYVRAFFFAGTVAIGVNLLVAAVIAVLVVRGYLPSARQFLRYVWFKALRAWRNGFVASFGGLAAVAAAPLLVAVFFALASTALGLVPVLGMVAAERHIVRWVIEPEGCQQLLDRDARLLNIERSMKREDKKTGAAPRTALCVKVTRNGNVRQGRVVFSTASAVILFCSKTGEARRVPIDGAEIEAIGSE
jgi:hypothetical protein